MPEHYTRNTLEATVWCNPCYAITQHRVDDGRRGPCLVCMAKQEARNKFERIKRGLEEEQRKEREEKNPTLF
jgi:hypothetical protein